MDFSFEGTPSRINGKTILRIPRNISQDFPSRGIVLLEGVLNGKPVLSVLEPDGQGSHYLNLKENSETSIRLEGRISDRWPEPDIPDELDEALHSDPPSFALWKDVTPMARWDWIRWIRSAKKIETRNKRIQRTLEELKSGKRRPCCFNRNLCTDTTISHSGILIEDALS